MRYPIDHLRLGNISEVAAQTIDAVSENLAVPARAELVDVWVGPTSGTLVAPHSFEAIVNDNATAVCTFNLLANVAFPSYARLDEQSKQVFLAENDGLSFKNKTAGATIDLRFKLMLRQL